jgi:hypothetical protein
MKNFIKAAGLAGILVAVLATAPGLKADQPNNAVREGHAVTTELGGNASAVTYWVNKSDGWHASGSRFCASAGSATESRLRESTAPHDGNAVSTTGAA